MAELSGQGVVVVPILLKDCAVPPLLRDRLYADFRTDYDEGLGSLRSVLEQESETVEAVVANPPVEATCQSKLAKMSLARIREWIVENLTRIKVADAWFDTFDAEDMANQLGQVELGECVIKLISRAKQDADAMQRLVDHLCRNYPQIVDP